jgi:phage tail protein X
MTNAQVGDTIDKLCTAVHIELAGCAKVVIVAADGAHRCLRTGTGDADAKVAMKEVKSWWRRGRTPRNYGVGESK